MENQTTITGIFLGFVSHNDCNLPIKRPNKTKLQNTDYVKPAKSSIFPFSMDGIIFKNPFCRASYMNKKWILEDDDDSVPMKSIVSVLTAKPVKQSSVPVEPEVKVKEVQQVEESIEIPVESKVDLAPSEIEVPEPEIQQVQEVKVEEVQSKPKPEPEVEVEPELEVEQVQEVKAEEVQQVEESIEIPIESKVDLAPSEIEVPEPEIQQAQEVQPEPEVEPELEVEQVQEVKAEEVQQVEEDDPLLSILNNINIDILDQDSDDDTDTSISDTSAYVDNNVDTNEDENSEINDVSIENIEDVAEDNNESILENNDETNNIIIQDNTNTESWVSKSLSKVKNTLQNLFS